MATSQSRTLIATNALFLGLATIAVIMRIYARKQKVRYLQAEDYLILAALVKPPILSVAWALLKMRPSSSSPQAW